MRCREVAKSRRPGHILPLWRFSKYCITPTRDCGRRQQPSTSSMRRCPRSSTTCSKPCTTRPASVWPRPRWGVARRAAVMDGGAEENDPTVMCNPEIIELHEPEPVDEGCLSVPDHHDEVERYRRVRFRAQDRDGTPYEMEAEDLLAQCVQ